MGLNTDSMAIVINDYICVRRNTRKNAYKHNKYKDTFLIKANNTKNTGRLDFHTISFPKKYVGKRIKLKIISEKTKKWLKEK